jgi:hypothetical protein
MPSYEGNRILSPSGGIVFSGTVLDFGFRWNDGFSAHLVLPAYAVIEREYPPILEILQMILKMLTKQVQFVLIGAKGRKV